MRVFRLIDVKTKAVVQLANVHIADFEYIALSYVWGSAQRLVMNLGNMDNLGEPGALNGTVSETIEDAMSLTAMLGIQYLWVDALCILQDDPLDKSHQLPFMDQVYRYSQLTIIAAAGADAEAGLPGLSEPRALREHIIKVKDGTAESPDIHLAGALKIRPMWHSNCLFDTTWRTRGWTLQEKAVSRRTLTFTPTQIYWHCREATWMEGIFSETSLVKPMLYDSTMETEFLRINSKMGEAETFDDSLESAWEQLRAQIVEFSARHLTNPGDALDAFSAILQEFRRTTGENFLWATPVTRFELGLCWNQAAPIVQGASVGSPLARRTELTTLPTTSLSCRVPFPSWSWLGWMGGAEVCFTDRCREAG